ncbi:MAG: amidase family protein, partial [Litorivicinus sp.]
MTAWRGDGPAWLPRLSVRPQDVWSSRFEVPASGNGTLDGLRVAVKDLFDVAGHPTLAGRKALLNTAPAASNAAAVQCLLDAGASLVGHTTMSQLAFSGIGQNPDFGRSI